MNVCLLNCRISLNGKSSKIHYAYLTKVPRGHQKLKTKIPLAWRARIKKWASRLEFLLHRYDFRLPNERHLDQPSDEMLFEAQFLA